MWFYLDLTPFSPLNILLMMAGIVIIFAAIATQVFIVFRPDDKSTRQSRYPLSAALGDCTLSILSFVIGAWMLWPWLAVNLEVYDFFGQSFGFDVLEAVVGSYVMFLILLAATAYALHSAGRRIMKYVQYAGFKQATAFRHHGRQ